MKKADSTNFLSKINSAKSRNALKVLSSYYYSRLTGSSRHYGLPFTVSIEPTTSCNLRCPECPSGLRSFSRNTGRLSGDLFRKTVDEMQHHLLYLYFYFQGEPFLHPQLLEFINYASSKGIYTVTSTNAHFLNDEIAKGTVESGLDRVIISIDGTTQEIYQNYRIGGQLEKVIEGSKNLIHWKKKLNSKTPHIIFQFLVVKQNQHQINEVYSLANELGVDEVKLKTAQIYDFENGSEFIPTIEKFSRYQFLENGFYRIKNDLLNHCWKMWHSCVITWDGWVVPCCFDKDAQHRFGNVAERSFRDIWNSKAYIDFRKKILTGRKEIDICRNCSEGTKVWA